jgi:hypothetical protein
MKKKIRYAVLALAFAAGAANAHQLWLEQAANGNAAMYFGEFNENLREASPGLLDGLGKPAAMLASATGEADAQVSKINNGFILSVRANPGESIVAEDARYPLFSKTQDGKKIRGWYYPAARLITDFSPQASKLPLDLLPGLRPGEFRVFYKGQPLPKAKVTLAVQSGWLKEGHADENGIVKFDMSWQGTYVAEVKHSEAAGGERRGTAGGERYDQVDYVTSLTYVKPDGIRAVPAGPAAPPNK